MQTQLPSKLLLQVSFWGGILTVAWILGIMVWFNVQARDIWMEGRHFTASLMAEGLSNAVQNDMVSRNYAELEGHLRQAVSDSRVKSVLLTDTNGQVLSHVERDDASQAIQVKFETQPLSLPAQPNYLQEDENMFIQWARLDNGVPLGWLRLEMLATKTDQALSELRLRFLMVFGVASLVLVALLLMVTRRAHQLIRQRESTFLENQEYLEGVAYRDSLTQLPNRHALLERMDKAIARCVRQGESMLVCFLDLDGFKHVNDTLGHDAGDEVLREVARRLTLHVRDNDTVARLGGDEFVLVLTRIEGLDQCQGILQRILNALSQPIAVMQTQVRISASMGVTIYPGDDTSANVLLEHADQAMYKAKRDGKTNGCSTKSVARFGLRRANGLLRGHWRVHSHPAHSGQVSGSPTAHREAETAKAHRG